MTDGSYRHILAIARSLCLNIRLVVTSRLAEWDEYLEAVRDGAFGLIVSPSQKADVVRVIHQAQREDQKKGMPVAASKTLKASAVSSF